MKTKLTNPKNSVPLCELSDSVLKKMRITLLTLAFSILAFGFSWGQTLEWVKGFGGANNDSGNSITVDDNGNVYATGTFQGTVDFNPNSNINNILTSNGNLDIFITKYDKNGNFKWVKQIGSVGEDNSLSITCDKYGNAYITGMLYSNLIIYKIDSLGNTIWSKITNGNGGTHGYSIAVDSNLNVYSTGSFWGTTDFDPSSNTYNLTSNNNGDDIFICKYDSSGNLQWAKKAGGTTQLEGGYSIAVDDSGYVYCTGNFYVSIYFDSIHLTSGDESAFVCKLNSDGNYIWAKCTGGWDYDQAYSLTIDNAGSVYVTGRFQGIVDFDPGINEYNLNSNAPSVNGFILKLNSTGNFVWAKNMGSILEVCGNSIIVDKFANVYTTGYFQGIADFNTGVSTYEIQSFGVNSNDVFISKLDSSGNFVYAKQFGGISLDKGNSIYIKPNGNICVTGLFNDTANYKNYSTNLISNGQNDIFIIEINQSKVVGNVFNDINQNCINNEIGLQKRLIKIEPLNIISQSDEAGFWNVDSLPIGTYTAILDYSGKWSPTCPVTQTFIVTNPDETIYVPDFGLVSTQPCANPDVSVYMPFMRPCFSNQKVYVTACNQYIATGVLNSAYAEIELDSLITLQSASLAYTSLGNNSYRFQLGTLNPGQCVNFTINCNVSCDAMLGQTLCLEANLYPADSCVFDTIPEPYPGDFTPCTLPWDKSSLQVEAYCQNDSIYFVITNTGDFGGGDMDCFSPVRIYIDGTYTTLDSIKLVGGDSIVFVFVGDGRTWRLEADQHPLHPGNSHPNATVEACGNLANWTPDKVNVLPPNDADPIVDIYCGLVTGSYDPNDKTGYPTGLAYNHYIMPNQQLQYVIRFQNTGTDTAFTVVVRDTLDMDLDIFSVVQGVASHAYNFQMYGPRVLEWTFYNIQLPDSNHNEAESHGFCTFTVNQNHDLANNTKITNSADIYFDYNAPITTNQTLHTVNDQVQVSVVTKVVAQGNKVSEVMIYPNPASNEVFIEILNVEQQMSNVEQKKGYKVFGIDGKKVLEGKLETPKTRISTKELESGVYFVEVNVGGEKVNGKLVITK